MGVNDRPSDPSRSASPSAKAVTKPTSTPSTSLSGKKSETKSPVAKVSTPSPSTKVVKSNPEPEVPSVQAVDDTSVIVTSSTFKSLGVCESLCSACDQLGWKHPTKIQYECVPHGLQNKDIIGLAETGSGKTAAFAIPILQALLDQPRGLFALVLAPTRELAFQISEQFEALGSGIGVKCATIVGGIDMMSQAIALGKKPHIVVATPGRLVDHLENTKGFSIKNIRFLVLDEADRMLSMDFEAELDKIVELAPRDRITFLFSATMTRKVEKLQRASLKDPVRVEVSSKYQTVDTLQQSYLFVPAKFKDCYLAYILNEMAGYSTIIFTSTCKTAIKTTLILRTLGFSAIPLHGQMTQAKRLGSLHKFKAGARSILVATDVASRGLDIPSVDVVVNFDIPSNSKDYIHRVGRTARAGRSGRAINFVTQYDVELYQKIEHMIGQKLDLFPSKEEEVLLMLERVSEAQRLATMEYNEIMNTKKKGKRGVVADDDELDTEDAGNAVRKLHSNKKQKI